MKANFFVFVSVCVTTLLVYCQHGEKALNLNSSSGTINFDVARLQHKNQWHISPTLASKKATISFQVNQFSSSSCLLRIYDGDTEEAQYNEISNKFSSTTWYTSSAKSLLITLSAPSNDYNSGCLNVILKLDYKIASENYCKFDRIDITSGLVQLNPGELGCTLMFAPDVDRTHRIRATLKYTNTNLIPSRINGSMVDYYEASFLDYAEKRRVFLQQVGDSFVSSINVMSLVIKKRDMKNPQQTTTEIQPLPPFTSDNSPVVVVEISTELCPGNLCVLSRQVTLASRTEGKSFAELGLSVTKDGTKSGAFSLTAQLYFSKAYKEEEEKTKHDFEKGITEVWLPFDRLGTILEMVKMADEPTLYTLNFKTLLANEEEENFQLELKGRDVQEVDLLDVVDLAHQKYAFSFVSSPGYFLPYQAGGHIRTAVTNITEYNTFPQASAHLEHPEGAFVAPMDGVYAFSFSGCLASPNQPSIQVTIDKTVLTNAHGTQISSQSTNDSHYGGYYMLLWSLDTGFFEAKLNRGQSVTVQLMVSVSYDYNNPRNKPHVCDGYPGFKFQGEFKSPLR